MTSVCACAYIVLAITGEAIPDRGLKGSNYRLSLWVCWHVGVSGMCVAATSLPP